MRIYYIVIFVICTVLNVNCEEHMIMLFVMYFVCLFLKADENFVSDKNFLLENFTIFSIMILKKNV